VLTLDGQTMESSGSLNEVSDVSWHVLTVPIDWDREAGRRRGRVSVNFKYPETARLDYEMAILSGDCPADEHVRVTCDGEGKFSLDVDAAAESGLSGWTLRMKCSTLVLAAAVILTYILIVTIAVA